MTRHAFSKGLPGSFLAGLFVLTYGFFIKPALRLRVRDLVSDETGCSMPLGRIGVEPEIIVLELSAQV